MDKCIDSNRFKQNDSLTGLPDYYLYQNMNTFPNMSIIFYKIHLTELHVRFRIQEGTRYSTVVAPEIVFISSQLKRFLAE